MFFQNMTNTAKIHEFLGSLNKEIFIFQATFLNLVIYTISAQYLRNFAS